MLYKGKERILWIDWLKVIAIVGVILLHSSSQYMNADILYSFNWYVGAVFEGFTRFGVVLFIMVSGYLILSGDMEISTVPRRIKRVFIPFVFWLVICGIAKFFIVNHSLAPLGIIKFILLGFLDPTTVSIQFWYVYMIIGLYVFAPILSKWIHNSKMFEVEYFLVIWFILLLIRFFDIDFLLFDYLRYFSGAVGYFILGYYLSYKKSEWLRNRKFGLLLFLAGSLLCVFGTIGMTYATGKPSLMFFSPGEITPNACLQGIGLYIMIRNTDFSVLSNRINRTAIKISIGSYGVYLSNILYINILEKVPIFSIYGNAIIAIPIVFIVVMVFSYFVIFLMSKIRFIDRFSGVR